jgi:hypothetical protein
MSSFLAVTQAMAYKKIHLGDGSFFAFNFNSKLCSLKFYNGSRNEPSSSFRVISGPRKCKNTVKKSVVDFYFRLKRTRFMKRALL